MKKNILALLMAGMLVICSCTAEKDNIVDDTQNDPVIDNPEEIPVSAESELKKILSGEVINAETNEKVKFSDLDSEFIQTHPARYCILDLDGNGENEYLVEFSDYGNTAIVHKFENEFYAHMIPFRARLDLKTDGEMRWSAGDSFIGTYRVVFTGKDMELIKPLDSDFDKDVHYIDGKEVSFEEASKAWDEFDAKENADWLFVYDILEE